MTDFPHSSELPWGSWLRTATSPFGAITIVDEQGRHWQSVRDVFWSGRLRMSMSSPMVRDEQLELMLAALASRCRGIVQQPERSHLIFGGNHQYARFWAYWMHAEKLIGGGFRDDPLHGKLTPEGVAALRMLAATRPMALNGVPIGRSAIEFFGEPGTPDECDRSRFEAAEASARMLPIALVREYIFGSPAISMLHRDRRDVVPLARTIWHMAWPDKQLRDQALRWMYERSDRWNSWGEMVLADGAAAFTQHLLVLFLAGNEDRHLRSGPDRAGPLSLTHGS